MCVIQLVCMAVCFEGLLVVLGFVLFCVERSQECRVLCQAVVEPLTPSPAEECVVKVILLVWFAGGAASYMNEGSTILRKSSKKRDFDPTKGYAGQDISQNCRY